MNNNFDQLSIAFLKEFRNQKNSTFHHDIEIADLRDQGRGRGIIATASIPPDTELFSIPRDYVISVENSRLHQQLPHLFDETDEATEQDDDGAEVGSMLPKSWLDLILVLIHDLLHGDTSKWKAYWDVLPSQFDTLMFWSDEALAELQASSVRDRIGKTSADHMFKTRIIPVVKKYSDTFFPDSHAKNEMTDDRMLMLCHRMGSLIMAYAFDLQTTDENAMDNEPEEEDGWAVDTDAQTAMGMVPMADMLNADAEFNAHLEHGDDRLTMRSLREIKCGEEILNYYGPLSNGDLARRYGYTSVLHSRHDVVEISWDLIYQSLKECLIETTVVGMLKTLTDTNDLEESFVLERETGDPDDTGMHTTEAKFTTFPEELVDQVTFFTSAALKPDNTSKKLNEQEKRKLKVIFLKTMAKAILARLQQYQTTLEEDEALLKRTDVEGHLRMAIVIRSGEKKLLREAGDLVSELLAKYGSDGDGKRSEMNANGGPPKKKQKLER